MKALDTLKENCKKAIEQAAYDSYSEQLSEGFEGCSAMVNLKGNSQIEISATKKRGEVSYEVLVYHDDMNETPNIENSIKDYLEAECDLDGEWQKAYDEDDYRGCDPGCDPAFPHYGDYERYRYGSYPYFK